MHRTRLTTTLGAGVVLGASLLGPSAAAAAGAEPDVTIVSSARQLSATEIRGYDITETGAGARALKAAADDSFDVNRRPHRVFDFEGQVVVVDAKSPLTVVRGLNKAGDAVFDANPTARPVGVPGTAGYAVPPDNRWSYNTDGGFITNLGTWKQTVHWHINVAWNYKPCTNCTAHQYFRIYGRMQAAVLTGSNPDQGYKRAWIEFDNNGAWGGSPFEFELQKPEESYHGTDNVTLTIGFANNANFKIGIPPVELGGGISSDYKGTLTKFIEYWWPVVRPELASGGVQFCRYAAAEFHGAKVIATTVGIRQAVNAQLGGWNILKGMEDKTDRCPPQE